MTSRADEGDGTLVSFHQEVGCLGSFFGRFADPLVVRMYARDVSNKLDNLMALLEAWICLIGCHIFSAIAKSILHSNRGLLP